MSKSPTAFSSKVDVLRGGSLVSTLRSQIAADPELPRPMQAVPLWQLPPHPVVASIQSTALPQSTDYVVIGSGVTGCGAVKTLLNNPASKSGTVTLLEARTLCSGATGRNGGQLVKPYPPRFALHVEKFGIETAKKVARLGLRTLEKMHELAASEEGLKEESNIRRLHKCLVYLDESSWNKAMAWVKLYEDSLPEERGLFKMVTKEELASVSIDSVAQQSPIITSNDWFCLQKYNVKGAQGGFKLPAGTVWPYRLITGVFKRLLDEYPTRFVIETNTPAIAIEHDGTNSKYPYIVSTPRGAIRAGTVIHCTNGHAGHLLPRLRGKIQPWRGTMSTQAPGKQFPKLGEEQSWTFLSDPVYNAESGLTKLGWFYAQQNPQTGDFWIGGEHKKIEECFTSDDVSIGDDGKKNLSTILPKVFNEKWIPKQPEVKGIWTGIMAYTGDALPFVGRLTTSMTGRQGQGEWISAGYNSYGMANGLSCGEALAKMILGEDVSEWFPEAYIVTDKRLSSPAMEPEAVLKRFFTVAGVEEELDKQLFGPKL